MNPQQLIQLVTQLRGSNNPMGMLQGMFGNDPSFSRAMQMAQGKNSQQLEMVIQNLCNQRGVDTNSIKSVINSIGIK